MNDHDHVLSARDVQFEYVPERPVLQGPTFSVASGTLTCVLGPNGCGKTTLLRCLLGWNKLRGGEVLLDSRAVSDYRPLALARLMAYVPQFPTASFAFPVQEIVLMGRFAHAGPMGLAAEADLAVARAAMEMTETLAFADRTLADANQ